MRARPRCLAPEMLSAAAYQRSERATSYKETAVRGFRKNDAQTTSVIRADDFGNWHLCLSPSRVYPARLRTRPVPADADYAEHDGLRLIGSELQ